MFYDSNLRAEATGGRKLYGKLKNSDLMRRKLVW